MAYNNNIPLPPDLLSDSQGEMHDNFEAIAALFAVNHYPFNDADQGKHRMCTFPVQGPFIEPLANEIKLKGRTSRYTNVPELVYRNGIDAAFNNMTSKRTPMPQVGSSWAFLGGKGILMKWGYAEFVGDGNVLFPDDDQLTIPRFTAAPYNIQVSVVSPGNGDLNVAVRTKTKSALNFTVYCSPRTLVGATEVGFFYLAIGQGPGG